MGARNLVMLKTHIGSINLSIANGFVYENMIWALASLWVFFCNFVFCSLGLILRYLFRFHEQDRKSEHLVPHDLDQSKRIHVEDSKADGIAEELTNLLFPIFEDFHAAIDEREGETECPVLLESDSGIKIHKNASKLEGETECSVFIEADSNVNQDSIKIEGEIECPVLKEKDSYMLEDGEKRDGPIFMDSVNQIGKNETDWSISTEDDSNFPQDDRKKVQEEKAKEDSFFTYNDFAKASCFVEEPRVLTFTFQQNYMPAIASNIICPNTENPVRKEFSYHNLEKGLVAQEEAKEHSVQEQRNITSNSNSGQINFAFGRSDSSDDEEVTPGPESCSGYIDNSATHQIMSPSSSSEEFGFESHKGNNDEKIEDSEESQYSCDNEVSHNLNFHLDHEKDENEDFDESDFDEEEEEEEEEDDDDFEWEHDEVVEQLRMELKNARQGGLATILEEEETESPKVVEDLKPLKVEEKIEFKDHIVAIQKVYRCYAEKIRKLDVLNYQTMHAIGLLELKDPLKLMLIPKSTLQSQSGKPLISQNLWPRKALKQVSDPILKFVHELHRDLELVYVGQVCLSWEILCWQHKKVEELKQYDSKWPRSYNLVAGEFQLFQVLIQRFLEDEQFQGPRIQNYLRNRCVIRNLLQVPAIKDDNTKDKKIIKLGEEYAIDSERLEQIIKECMRVFWEFVKADKDYGNVIKNSHYIGIDLKDPAISDLLGDVRTQLQKKEKRLKDLVRSGNCLVRKFQKHHEEQIQLDQEQLLAQVGLRLVSRVVKMKKLSKDQLMWCNEKLNRIKFVGRKVQVEPSILFFPC
ncbi:hypothetical protein VNO78_12229 [Psophocarpus tetragonolobus]|uniref:Ribosomal protein L34Ae n=1 Tax=Psophocarpus tetragonolobus TaxID=3891 RepID=A0AAN9SQD9_PSOTE